MYFLLDVLVCLQFGRPNAHSNLVMRWCSQPAIAYREWGLGWDLINASYSDDLPQQRHLRNPQAAQRVLVLVPWSCQEPCFNVKSLMKNWQALLLVATIKTQFCILKKKSQKWISNCSQHLCRDCIHVAGWLLAAAIYLFIALHSNCTSMESIYSPICSVASDSKQMHVVNSP